MSKIFIFLLMIFMHTLADYNLQGWLASAKHKNYWKDYEPRCRYDYIVALFIHSFQWCFLVMLPVVFCIDFKISYEFIFWFIWNLIVHMLTDNLKANKKCISLITDQIIHMIQIILTFFIFV